MMFGKSEYEMSLQEYLGRASLYQRVFNSGELDEDGDAITIKWFVIDSRIGYAVLKLRSDSDTKGEFQKHFHDRNEAIEWCYEAAKAEEESLKAQKVDVA
jgi:hypothetical protein